MVLIAPGETYARERMTRARASERVRNRDSFEDGAVAEDDGGYNVGRRSTGLRLTFRGGVPQSLWGRASAAAALLAILGVGWVAVRLAHDMVLRDERFVLESSSSISTEGNHHLSRSELLDVFGGDLQRSVLKISLEDRKAALEQIPWVKHATVMRFLPNHLHVEIVERTPVAFFRQGGHICLVDANGVLLEMRSEEAGYPGYSFPVITGLAPGDPISLRAARMKIFQDFKRDLDAKGENISAKVSEVDLSDPEDIKALVPEQGADVLVHFGDSDFLERYERFESRLGEWRSQYPKLSAVDMRYERQVVLEMRPGTAVSAESLGGQSPELNPADASATSPGATPASRVQPKKNATSRPLGHAVVTNRPASSSSHLSTRASHP